MCKHMGPSKIIPVLGADFSPRFHTQKQQSDFDRLEGLLPGGVNTKAMRSWSKSSVHTSEMSHTQSVTEAEILQTVLHRAIRSYHCSSLDNFSCMARVCGKKQHSTCK